MNVQDGNAGILLPNVLVLLLLGWGMFKSAEPLESKRPQGGKLSAARVGPEQSIQARSWEDPFEAIADAAWASDEFWVNLISRADYQGWLQASPKDGVEAGPARGEAEKEEKKEPLIKLPTIDGKPIGSVGSIFGEFHDRLGSVRRPDANRGLVLLVTLPGSPFAMPHEKRHRIRYAVVAGLANAGYAPVEDSRLGASYYLPWFGEDPNQKTKPEMILYEQFAPISRLTEWREKRFLRIMVLYLNEDYLGRPRPGEFAHVTGRVPWTEPEAEDRERSEQISPGERERAVEQRRREQTGDEGGIFRRTFRAAGDALRGLIDRPDRTAERLGFSHVRQGREPAPLASLAALIQRLRAQAERTRDGDGAPMEIQIIGPTTSDLLVKMMGEGLVTEYLDMQREWKGERRLPGGVMDIDERALRGERGKGRNREERERGYRPPRIWAAMPTLSDRQLRILVQNHAKSFLSAQRIDDPMLKRKYDQEDALVEKAFEGLRGKNRSRFQFLCGLQVERVSPDDGLLARALAAELRNRGVDPRNGKDAVLLVTELETSYARAIVQSFRVAVLDPDGSRRLGTGREQQIDIGHEDIIQQVSYLRGVDGQRGKDRIVAPKERDAESPGSWTLSGGLTESTTGYSQFDYLQRLVKRARVLEEAKEGRRFKAIGILGSDIFDKLVVLQALRQEFPHVTFFTTDLDAVYLKDSEQRWTHNLVVASGFGLNHHPRIQNTIAPFRDTYQAATYLATLEAVGYFVEGRHVREEKGYAPPTYRDQALKERGERGYALERRVPERPSPGVARVFEVGRVEPELLGYYGETGNEFTKPDKWEARRLSQLTVSASWPFLILLGGYFVLTLAPVFRYRAALRRRAEELDNDSEPRAGLVYDEKTSRRTLVVLLTAWAAVTGLWFFVGWANDQPEQEPMGVADGVSTWPTAFIQLLTVILAVFCVWKSWKDLQNNRQEIDERFEEVLEVEEGMDVPPAPKTRILWLVDAYSFLFNSENLARSQRTLRAFWRVYRNRSAQGERVGRALIAIVVLIVPLFLLVWAGFGGSPVPVRGEWSRLVFISIQFSAFSAAHFLLFYAVDAALLSWAFQRGLRVLIEEGEDPLSRLEDRAQRAEETDAANQRPRDRAMVRIGEERYGRWETLLVLIGAERGRQVNAVLILPFFVFFLLFVSRHGTFDHFSPAFSVVLPALVAFVVLIVVSMLMRGCAKGLFAMVEERIRKSRAMPEPEQHELAEEAGEVFASPADLEEWRDTREAALKNDWDRLQTAKQKMEFRLWSNPLLKGALIPLGGTGILALMEILVPLLK